MCPFHQPSSAPITPMKPTPAKSDRISARVPHEVYETLRHAADLAGATVSQFLVQSALKEAREMIEREQIIRLSRRDCERLLDLLENPPPPNARFQAAMNYYEQSRNGDADHSFDWQP
jgi:uncharacterized protein (DUF1778 family)